MTWTKLGDEFSDEARDVTDAEFRTHVEALLWSNRRLLDLHVPKRDVRRFAESPDADAAVDGLVVKGWWEDRGEVWYIGVRFPEWQRDRSQVENRRAYLAEAQRRSRKHKAGDHADCLPPSECKAAASPVDETVESTVDVADDRTVDPGRVGSGTTYPPDPSEDQDQDQGQGQERSVANSQKTRVHDGSEELLALGRASSVAPQAATNVTDRKTREEPPDRGIPGLDFLVLDFVTRYPGCTLAQISNGVKARAADRHSTVGRLVATGQLVLSKKRYSVKGAPSWAPS
jgi:hypothetical protein